MDAWLCLLYRKPCLSLALGTLFPAAMPAEQFLWLCMPVCPAAAPAEHPAMAWVSTLLPVSHVLSSGLDMQLTCLGRAVAVMRPVLPACVQNLHHALLSFAGYLPNRGPGISPMYTSWVKRLLPLAQHCGPSNWPVHMRQRHWYHLHSKCDFASAKQRPRSTPDEETY